MSGTGTLAPPDRADYPNDGAYRFAQSIFGLLRGQGNWGVPSSLTSYSSASTYSLTVENQGASGLHLNVPNVLQAVDSGVTVNNLVVSGTLVAGATTVTDLTFSGNLLSTGTGKTFKADFSNATLANRFYLQSSTAAATGVGILPGSGATTSGIAAFNSTNLAAVGFLNLQMLSTEGRITVSHIGASYLPLTFYTAGAEAARFDTNSRLLVGIATAPSATNDKAHVAGGRLYVSAGSETAALGLRYVSTDGSFFLGASDAAAPDLVLSNNAGTQRARLVDGGGFIVGAATAMVGSELLLVKGGAQVEGLLTVTSGGLDITGTGTFQNAINVKGNSTLGDASGDTLTVNATPTFNTAISHAHDLSGTAGTFTWANSGNNRIEAGSTGLGFFGAAQIARPTVTGVRTGTLGQLQTVVGNLIAALAALGLVTDSTT